MYVAYIPGDIMSKGLVISHGKIFGIHPTICELNMNFESNSLFSSYVHIILTICVLEFFNVKATEYLFPCIIERKFYFLAIIKSS